MDALETTKHSHRKCHNYQLMHKLSFLTDNLWRFIFRPMNIRVYLTSLASMREFESLDLKSVGVCNLLTMISNLSTLSYFRD